jgi:hypothetical protein
MLRRLLSSAVMGAMMCATICVASQAHADIKDAEELFRQGKAEMAKANYDKACPMFAESYKQDPAMGTLLNLALCHEAIGRIASAWGEWRAVEQQARAAVPPREDRIKMAKEHAEKLEPRLSRIKVLVPADARVDGLTIKIDGEAKGEPLWNGIPVDPGTRMIIVSAPGKKTLTREVKIDDEGVVVPLTIPKLEDAPASEQRPPGATSVGPDLEKVEEYASNQARRTTGFVIGGIGIATLAVGGAFGIGAIINDGSAKDACPAPCIRGSAEAADADAKTDRAFVFSNIANVTLPLGIIGAAVGAYLVLTAGPTERVAIAPLASSHARGVAITASW